MRGTTSKAVIFDYTPPTLGLYGVAGNNYITASEKPAALITGLSDAVGRTVTLRIDGTVVGTVQPSGPVESAEFGQWAEGAGAIMPQPRGSGLHQMVDALMHALV